MNSIPPQMTGAGLPFPTDDDLQNTARARHEHGQRLLLPLRLREWRVPPSEHAALLRGENVSGAGPEAPQHVTPALRYVARWREDSEWCLVLWGGYRVGKTHAALRWLATAAKVPFYSVELGQTFSYATSARFMPFTALADAAGSFRDHHQALVAEAVAARALVLDDVGAQLRAAAPILDQVISARHLHRRPTLITTNLGRDLFVRPDHYGLRVVLRLEEGGAFKGCGGDPERLALRAALEDA